MLIINALRDFADGLSRGVSMFFADRQTVAERPFMPGRNSGQKR